MTSKEAFDSFGAFEVKKALSLDLCRFFTTVLMRQASLTGGKGDRQVPSAPAIMSHEIMFDTLLEVMWPMMEEVVQEELVPTYSYARLYQNGNDLKPHTDRPSCEVSMTLQLGRSHHYAWPIYVKNKRFDLAEGDAIVYKGNEVEHWREVCNGPDGYYSGQVFLHYVRKNGPYAEEHFCDKTNREILPGMFVLNRNYLMELK